MPKTPGVRFPRVEIERIADLVIAAVRPFVSKIYYAGSFRRGLPDSGDVDVLCIPTDSKSASSALAALCDGGRLESGSGEGLDIGDVQGVPVNLFYTSSETWGSAHLYTTGSKEYNISTRMIAKRRGLKLTQAGVFTRSGRLVTSGPTEADVCRAIGIPWLPPEQRTGSAFRPGSRDE